jgi:DMSO/TMAO reductase YedYZ molybdopterin-dependent catalytic subunit/mono/diheme cytochrome c family protein
LPDGLDAATFHVHNLSPLALEAKRSAMGAGVITPLSRFFVRNNLPRPSERILANRKAWSLELDGVATPGSITLAQLQQLGVETVAHVVQCSGNGRAFYAHGPSGSPWATGAAGCALWTGVRVSKVLERFGGATDGMAFLTATGGEPIPEGVDRDTVIVERSIPLEKAMKDAMLVWEMNGEPLPISHGGPLRLIVPGYFGCNQIKYVKRIAATSGETDAKIQKKGYRFRPIGESGSPAHPSMWRMPVKSWVNGPGADDEPVLAGPTTFYGVALSGERGIAKVEVSMDDGATWTPAELVGPDLGPNAWRTFQYTADLAPGTHTILSRATDTTGEFQPESRVPNERGYGHNGWRDHGLTVRVVAELDLSIPDAPAEDEAVVAAAPAEPVELSEAGKRGKAVFTEQAQPACGACHTLADAGTNGAVGPNLNALAPDAARVQSAVTGGVGTMPSFEASLSEQQIQDVATYVFEATKP